MQPLTYRKMYSSQSGYSLIIVLHFTGSLLSPLCILHVFPSSVLKVRSERYLASFLSHFVPYHCPILPMESKFRCPKRGYLHIYNWYSFLYVPVRNGKAIPLSYSALPFLPLSFIFPANSMASTGDCIHMVFLTFPSFHMQSFQF